MGRATIFEFAGGDQGFLALATAHHETACQRGGDAGRWEGIRVSGGPFMAGPRGARRYRMTDDDAALRIHQRAFPGTPVLCTRAAPRTRAAGARSRRLRRRRWASPRGKACGSCEADNVQQITRSTISRGLSDEQASQLPGAARRCLRVDSLGDAGPHLHDVLGRLFRRPTLGSRGRPEITAKPLTSPVTHQRRLSHQRPNADSVRWYPLVGAGEAKQVLGEAEEAQVVEVASRLRAGRGVGGHHDRRDVGKRVGRGVRVRGVPAGLAVLLIRAFALVPGEERRARGASGRPPTAKERMHSRSQSSPTVVPSCMSSGPPGVTKLNAGSPSLPGDSAVWKAPELIVPSGTSQVRHSPRHRGRRVVRRRGMPDICPSPTLPLALT